MSSYISLVGEEARVVDVERPFITVDSSSLSIQRIPCPGAGHRGQRIDFRRLEICSKGGLWVTYIASCRVGCEVYKEASKAPSVVVDSSSLVVEFPRK